MNVVIILFMVSMLTKNNFLSILLSMEFIMVLILYSIYMNLSKFLFLFYIVFMVSESVLGLILCIKFSFVKKKTKLESSILNIFMINMKSMFNFQLKSFS
uniref:NADH dehydrogenase subunit 4L n=1 Tax=Liposcelis paeta TaxID=209927 RepID=A0A096X737_9NEOP|nr:NADH dehydrogenase subunit 4L [Liposcelis paeta]